VKRALGLLITLTTGAAAQEYTLVLRPARDNLPNVMAALDPAAAIDPNQLSLNPFLYECVAFLQLRAPTAPSSRSPPTICLPGPLLPGTSANGASRAFCRCAPATARSW